MTNYNRDVDTAAGAGPRPRVRAVLAAITNGWTDAAVTVVGAEIGLRCLDG